MVVLLAFSKIPSVGTLTLRLHHFFPDRGEHATPLGKFSVSVLLTVEDCYALLLKARNAVSFQFQGLNERKHFIIGSKNFNTTSALAHKKIRTLRDSVRKDDMLHFSIFFLKICEHEKIVNERFFFDKHCFI